jgi:ubiquinone/menaquinone biosynthesis C-methylase UbiE
MTSTQKANVLYHTMLAPVYHEQPFLRADNRARVRRILEELRRRSGRGRLLDIGCGTGFIFDAAHDLFDRLDGVDITAEMLSRVERRPNVATLIAPAEALPFPDASFDLVTCNGVLHHIERLDRALAEARRVLRPGGVFYADEIPSMEFRQSLCSLSGPMSNLLSAEWLKVTADADRYSRLGIAPEATRAAMAQCYGRDELRRENLESLLAAAGFRSADIRCRWFLGQAQVRDAWGQEAAARLEEYLTSLLPLTRHLFKNLMFFAG